MANRAGTFPFDAGIQPDGYTTRLWTMRQLSGFGDAIATNRRFKEILDLGGTGLSLAFDLPTQHGLDSDDPRARGEVGITGVSLTTVDDLATVFGGIPLDEVSVSFTINATAPVVYAMWLIVAEENGLTPASLRGTLQNEMLKEHLARHAVIYDLDTSFRYSLDLIEYSLEHSPRVNPVTISGGHAREAGADAALEIACAIADADAYLEALESRGVGVDAVAPRLSFIFGSAMELLAEIAKFRAARRLYACNMVDRWRCSDERSAKLRVHVNTFGSALTAEEPLNNVIRATIQALAAVLGGVQSMHVCSFDEGHSLPSPLAARIAMRTQQIIATETDVAHHVDPLGGSVVVEQLVDRIALDAARWLDTIRSRGGMLECIRSGWLGSQLDDLAYEAATRPRAYRPMRSPAEDGLMRFPSPRRAGTPEPVRRRRLPELAALRRAAADGANIMPALIEAARARATVGQMAAALQPVTEAVGDRHE